MRLEFTLDELLKEIHRVLLKCILGGWGEVGGSGGQEC